MLFRDFLKSRVESSNLPYALKYIPAVPGEHHEEIFKPRGPEHKLVPCQDPITFKPTTPLFYSNIARSENVYECLAPEIQRPDPQASTFYTSHGPSLLALFEEPQRATKPRSSRSVSHLPRLDRLRWQLVFWLRRLRSRKIRSSSFVAPVLDSFALHSSDVIKACAYRRAVLKLLASDLLAFGVPGVLDLFFASVRIWLCWLCVQTSVGLIEPTKGQGRPTMPESGKLILGCVGIHLWWALGRLF